jgi:SNF2 family DNA or RNA helicase
MYFLATICDSLSLSLAQVLEHSQKEKILIFSSMPLTLAHVADALTLAGVMYLQYTTASPVHVRQQYVMTFETSDKYRVFLMELKHGSRGL